MDYKARFYDSYLNRWTQPDSIIPNPADPQGWNRFAYVRNSPFMLVDPTGHYEDEGCGMGETCELPPDDSPVIIEDEDEQDSGHSSNLVVDCFSDPGSCYMQGWSNFDGAWSIYSNPNATALNRIGAGLYMGVWVDAHLLLAAGAGGLIYAAYGAVVGGGAVCASTAPCQQQGASTLSRLVSQAQSLYPKLAGRLQGHHIFPKYLGGPANGPTARLDAAYHQVITNAFRDLWPYGGGKPALDVATQIVNKVYTTYPLPPGAPPVQ